MGSRLKIREEAKKLNPIDDIMFRKMAENKDFCQEILRVILSEPKLKVLEALVQWAGTNLQGTLCHFRCKVHAWGWEGDRQSSLQRF